MKKISLALATSYAFIACKKDPPPAPEPTPTLFVNGQSIVTQKPYRDTGNKVVGALDLMSGASIRCTFSDYPTANGTYKLVGIRQTLAANELGVTVNAPVTDSIDSTASFFVPLEAEGTEASVRVANGKISISIPRSRFVKFVTGVDTAWISASLQEE